MKEDFPGFFFTLGVKSKFVVYLVLRNELVIKVLIFDKIIDPVVTVPHERGPTDVTSQLLLEHFLVWKGFKCFCLIFHHPCEFVIHARR